MICLTFGASGRPGEDHGMDLFVEPRHADDERGADLLHVVNHLSEVLGEGDLAAGKHREVISGRPLQRMGERQEREEHVRVVDIFAEVVVDLARVGYEVVVREHDALRVARGARGVYDGGQVLRLDRFDPFVEIGLVLVGVPFLHGVGPVEHGLVGGLHLVDGDYRFESGDLLFRFQYLVRVVFRSGDADPRAGIFQYVTGFLRGVCGVYGHVGRSNGQDGQVRYPPLGPVLGKEGDTVTFFYPQGQEKAPELAYHFVHLIPGYVDILALFVVPVRDAGTVAVFCDLLLKYRRYRRVG